MSGRRIRVRPRRTSLSFLEVSPTKRRRIRKRNVKLASTFSSPKPAAQPSKSGIQSHDESEEDNGSERDSPDHYSQVHEELTSEDEECSKTSSYRKRQQRSASAWQQVRNQLLRASIECSVPSASAACVVCESVAVIICPDCGSQAQYCEDCTESVHSRQNIFHKPLFFKVNSNF